MIEHNNELQQKNKIPQPLLSPPASSKSSPVKKSSSWLSGLFQKQSKPISNNKKSKSGTLFNFFSSSKTSKQQQLSPKSSSSPAPQPKSLPKRYPMPIERVIYQIAFIKLRNPKRPLQHQVVVCNMIQWYTSIITKEATACKRHQLYLQKSLSM